jgi:hypothetical protein
LCHFSLPFLSYRFDTCLFSTNFGTLWRLKRPVNQVYKFEQINKYHYANRNKLARNRTLMCHLAVLLNTRILCGLLSIEVQIMAKDLQHGKCKFVCTHFLSRLVLSCHSTTIPVPTGGSTTDLSFNFLGCTGPSLYRAAIWDAPGRYHPKLSYLLFCFQLCERASKSNNV